MLITAKIPEHLDSYIESLSQETIDTTITLLLEYAISRNILTSPKTEIETDVSLIKQLIYNMNTRQESQLDKMYEKLAKLERHISDLPTITMTADRSREMSTTVEEFEEVYIPSEINIEDITFNEVKEVEIEDYDDEFNEDIANDFIMNIVK